MERTFEELLVEQCAPTLAGLKPASLFRYQAACRRLAEKHHAIFVDTQAPFDRILQSRHSSFISWDRVHPNDVGHTALAMAFLRAMEFDFEA